MRIIGKISGINTSDNLINLSVTDSNSNLYNLKISQEYAKFFAINDVFEFDVEEKVGERTQYFINSYKSVLDFDFKEKNESLRSFYNAAPLSLDELEKLIDNYLKAIKNKVIKEIAKKLIDLYHDDYFLYPAATKMHHAYIGGLAYHSVSMLKLADGVIAAYPYLNKDYIYAGILLHDIGKVTELTGVMDTSYSLKGQLLGHLVLGAMEIEDVAKKLGYENTDEVMLLEHMLISHHGLPQFGAAKKPTTPEALVLWYIDTIDSKFRVLGEVLENTEAGSYTEAIGVLDKMKVYKPKN